MTKKMLIDAAHPEEVRVALLGQKKIEDYDFESASRKPLRGNIFLARVTRVEPSLQAAFVDYGGNRHGFLAFSEIHPDYYQIPVSDREALQKAEQEVAALAAELELAQRGDEEADEFGDVEETEEVLDAKPKRSRRKRKKSGTKDDDKEATNGEVESEAADDSDAEEDGANDELTAPSDLNSETDQDDTEEEEEEEEERTEAKTDGDAPEDATEKDDTTVAPESSDPAETEQPWVDEQSAEPEAEEITLETEEEAAEAAEEDNAVEEVSEEEEAEKAARAHRNELFERYKEAKRKRSQLLRNYKIQEVIKRRQILLIQVVKEERGNKGAALTTYMSLAGRYCVLMPNTARGGGISRKISHTTDRRRLRRVVDSLEVPQGMGLIIRTAGAKRTKTEIKRDYDYLLRLWENIRTLTLKSIAPCLIYEEASLIKRAIRDLYDKDISKVLVEGEAGYREAKDFMKMLMPSHAKNVQPYKEPAPIFLRYGVEAQLDGMYQPSVRLKSGGYLVIHQTEALVAIDVNSGRATRERNIEQTALKTNIEAAEEAARQFRLRDLAGLVVIDFIDMEEPKNNRKVEKALKEALKSDRARLQVGRISPFGLLELSRQRRRSGIVDGTTQACPTCSGAGVIRSHEVAALRILRAMEGEAISGKVGLITLRASLDVSLHILNHHRDWIKRIEDNNGVSIEIVADTQKFGDVYDMEKSGAPKIKEEQSYIRADQTEPVEIEEEEADSEQADDESGESGKSGKKRRRRRRGRKDSVESKTSPDSEETSEDEGKQAAEESEDKAAAEEDNAEGGKKRRRRGRRGGRRNRRGSKEAVEDNATSEDAPTVEAADDSSPAEPSIEVELSAAQSPESSSPNEASPANGAAEAINDNPNTVPDDASSPDDASLETSEPVDSKPAKKKTKKGWWQRAVGG